MKLNHQNSQEKLSNHSGNYGSPTMDTRGNSEGGYVYSSGNYIDQVHHQQISQHNRKLNGSKIGQGLKKQQLGGNARAPSGQAIRATRDALKPIEGKENVSSPTAK